ncbi:polynucleotide adenylyltransferase PcnB [Treponema vincentii]|uniref:polynucleotide adenylyltransferase PcnB n=1 Tax=Treponema vincentii TaxID=69710 RepID=UPI0020A6049C|nr:polynucleotide adenylyltransferase PcnB [Treponema vincentii]UTC48479.1 polynucleotide adenylyltransferase PcnB [Treponema vincentii]
MLVRYTRNTTNKKLSKALIYTAAEHSIDPRKVDSEAIRIISGLHNAGYEAYIVGGAVRDLLIGKTPKDFDIATSAEPARIRKIFKNSRLIGKRFRLVHVFYGPKIYEVSTFRSLEEGSVGNNFGTIDEDVRRRDFTLNALYYDPIKNIIVDYVGGVEDIRKKRLNPIIDLSHIFVEDPVRMIRAIKYATITDAAIPLLLRYRIHRDAPLIEYVSPSRLTEEIGKILMSGHAAEIFKMLLHYRLFLYLQPSAFSFIEDSPHFSEHYFAGMEELDGLIAEHKIQRQGQALVYLIRDFLQLITNWKEEPRAVYKAVYAECRHFVLPMNPQRIELEYAVKYCLRKGGLDIRLTGATKAKEAPKRRPRGNARQGTPAKPAARISGKRSSKTGVSPTEEKQ